MWNPGQVRSSLAMRLKMEICDLVHSDKDVDGVVDMTLDAIQNFEKPLTKARLFAWHSLLFPTGRSAMQKIIVGNWRDDSAGSMRIVSGVVGKEKVHYQALPAIQIENEVALFINWFNTNDTLDPVLKAGVAHFWFVSIHPFEDGNGRISRIISDMLLAKADGSSQRFYSMSSQIRLERNGYYKVLEKSQKGELDITAWLSWFLNCLENALDSTSQTLVKVLEKHHFWNEHAITIFNNRQKLLINKILNGFDGKLTSSKWAKIAKCSPDTALRDIQDLITKKVLRKEDFGGRSTSYVLDEIKE